MAGVLSLGERDRSKNEDNRLENYLNIDIKWKER